MQIFLCVSARILGGILSILLIAPSLDALGSQPGQFRLRLVPPEATQVDLSRISFEELGALVQRAKDDGELVLPLPFAGNSRLGALDVRDVELQLDTGRHTLVLAGESAFKGRNARLFLSMSYGGSGPGQYSLGVRCDALVLGDWFAALGPTALGKVECEMAAVFVASAPHRLPSSKLVADILGLEESQEGLEVEAGVGLRATIAGQSLPALGRWLGALGIDSSRLRIRGRIGSSADVLAAALEQERRAVPLDLALHVEFETTALAGLQSRLPAWIRPTAAEQRLDFALAQEPGKSARLEISLSLGVQVQVAGESRDFRLSSALDTEGKDAQLSLKGETTGAWNRPLGLDWLSLERASLEILVDNKAGAALKGKLGSSLRVGTREAELEFAIESAGGGERVAVQATARLDKLTLGDLSEFVSRRTGTNFVRDLDLGDKAQLEDLVLSLKHEQGRNALELSARAGLGNARSDVLFTLTGGGGAGGKGQLDALFVVRRHAGRLSDLVPALAGKPADLEFPASVWTLTPAKAAGAARRLSSAELGPTAREFLKGVYGADFELDLEPGIRFGAALPVSRLPPALVEALGLAKDASLVLEGSLNASLDLGKGKLAGKLESLELQARLPRVTGAAARLPLPAWMRMEASSQRTLSLRYSAPANLTFAQMNDVLAELDGATRHFRVGLEVAGDGKQARAALTGSMLGEWKQPFGLKRLALQDVRLTIGAASGAGAGGAASGSVKLEGGFTLGHKNGRMQLELAAASGSEVTGSFTGSLSDIALEDLPELELFPRLPRDGLKQLASTLGQLPALEEPTLRVSLGGGQPAVSFTGHTKLRGTRFDLLVFVGKGASGPQAVLGLRPQSFSLAQLFPKLGQNPAVAPLANLTLDHFGLFAALGEQQLKSSDVDPGVRDFFAGVTGKPDFELKLSPGLSLEAHLDPSQLPRDMAQAIERLNGALGLDSPGGLSLRGSIGASLADLRLAAALPPIRPARAPKWLKSGELSIVLTGIPSLMLAGRLVLDCEGDLLELSLEGGVERQGANVAISLKTALQADGAWVSPFGMEWLEIRRFSGQVSIDALANIGFGGGGDVTIGSKDVKVFAWTKINSVTGAPVGLVLNAQSESGLALRDLAELQGEMRRAARARGPQLLPLDALPDIALRDIHLTIASRAVPEEGIASAGFKLKGDLYIPLRPGASASKLLGVDCSVDKSGIVAKGVLAAYRVGPLTWQDSSFDLEASLSAQHLLVHGRVELLGSSSETDLQLTREKLAFKATREIKGLGGSELSVASAFDLGHPAFRAHGQLDNEFCKSFSASSSGEAVDVSGKAAKVGELALKGVDKAREGIESVRKQLGLPTAREAIDALAARRLADAEEAAKAHKLELDAKYRDWQGTPTSEPVKRKARELLWKQSKFTYDEGPFSRIKVLERRKEEYKTVHAGVAALDSAKAEQQRVQAALGDWLHQIGAYQGKTIVITSASFDAKLESLMALKEGMPLDVSFELLLCGKPNRVTIPWIVGKPALNAKMLVTALLPGLTKLVNG